MIFVALHFIRKYSRPTGRCNFVFLLLLGFISLVTLPFTLRTLQKRKFALEYLVSVKSLSLLIAQMVVLGYSISSAIAQNDIQLESHQPVVMELISLLEVHPLIQQSLESAIKESDLDGIQTMYEFYAYLDDVITWIPTERELLPKLIKLYYIVNQAPEDSLNKDEQFNTWIKHLIQATGEFLDTPASAEGIESFTLNQNYNIDSYFVGPSGWLTFNQFFAREMRPGKRPIAASHDDHVIVSPADAVFMGSWPIDKDSKITVKGVTWAISDLLDGSPYENAFRNGIYMHNYLDVNDYHRYHIPVSGTVKEVRNISGKVYLDAFRQPDGTIVATTGNTFQFNQERGLVIIDSPEVGLVAILPIGMGFVSSVNLTPEVGAELRKGDGFGYFLFGGSDIVILFQDKNVKINAQVGKKYLQGQKLGHVK